MLRLMFCDRCGHLRLQFNKRVWTDKSEELKRQASSSCNDDSFYALNICNKCIKNIVKYDGIYQKARKQFLDRIDAYMKGPEYYEAFVKELER